MKILSVVLFWFVVAFVITAVMSLPVMLLWDWLMPQIFGLPEITWFQAWGLMFLCRLLFKSHTVSKE